MRALLALPARAPASAGRLLGWLSSRPAAGANEASTSHDDRGDEGDGRGRGDVLAVWRTDGRGESCVWKAAAELTGGPELACLAGAHEADYDAVAGATLG